MSLQLDVDVLRPVDMNQAVNCTQSFVITAAPQRFRQRSLFAAGQADESARVFFELVDGGRALTFLELPQLIFGDQTTQVLIACACFGKEGISTPRSFAKERIIH